MATMYKMKGSLRAMRYAKRTTFYMSHCECNENLTDGGVLLKAGLLGRTPEHQMSLEDMAVLKNILLAEKSGVRFIFYNSTKNAIGAIHQSKSVALRILRRKFRYSILRLPMKNASGITRTQRCIPPFDHNIMWMQWFAVFKTTRLMRLRPIPCRPSNQKNWHLWRTVWEVSGQTSFAVMNTYLVRTNHIPLEKRLRKWPFLRKDYSRSPKEHFP